MVSKNEKNWNGLRMRKHIASFTWISEDGKNAEVFFIDKTTGKENHFTRKIMSEPSGRKYIHDKNKAIYYIDEMVATCFLPPGNGLVLIHKDGNIANDHYKNLDWQVPFGKIHSVPGGPTLKTQSLNTSLPQPIKNIVTVTLSNGLTITEKGEVFQNGKKLEVKEYKNIDGIQKKFPPYVEYTGSNKAIKRLSVDTIMSKAGLISGDRSKLQHPRILHKDNDPLNFDSYNLEWVEDSDPRYQIYKSYKTK